MVHTRPSPALPPWPSNSLAMPTLRKQSPTTLGPGPGTQGYLAAGRIVCRRTRRKFSRLAAAEGDGGVRGACVAAYFRLGGGDIHSSQDAGTRRPGHGASCRSDRGVESGGRRSPWPGWAGTGGGGGYREHTCLIRHLSPWKVSLKRKLRLRKVPEHIQGHWSVERLGADYPSSTQHGLEGQHRGQR